MNKRSTVLKDLVLIFLGCAPLLSLSLLWWRGIDASAPIWPTLSGWEILALLISFALPVLVMRRLDDEETQPAPAIPELTEQPDQSTG